MALSYAQYAGDGSITTFSVPFQYLSRTHVGVTVNGVVRSFSWISANQISVTPAPAKGTVVEVRRTTPRDKILVDFVDGSVLTEGDLDTSALQSFFLAQEAFDLQGATLGLAPDGSFSAYNRRITNLGDPVNPTDAINKQYHDGTFIPQMNSLLAQTTQVKNDSVTAKGLSEAARDAANQSKAAAAVSEANAKASETNAKTSETNAASSASGATSSRDRAILAETNAKNSAQTATDKAGQAQSSANTALTQAGIAQTHKDAAAQSATNAANSATAADASKTKAMKWAEENEDVAVESGMFSAKHWAKKAQALAGAVKLPAIVAGAYMRGKADLSSWETVTPAQVRADIGAAAVSHTHSEYLPTSGGSVSNSISVTNGGTGRVTVHSGTSQFPGFIEFHTADGTRRGYIGGQPSANRLGLVSENGWNWYVSGHLYTTAGFDAEDYLKANRSIHLRGRNSPAWMWTSYMEGDPAYKLYWSNEAAPSQNGNKFFVDYQGHVWTEVYGYLHNYFLPRGGVNYNGDGTVQIGGLKVGGDGNIYMNWAGNWLSNLLYSKVNDQENCTGVGISDGVKIYANRRDGGGIVWAARSLTSNDVCLYWNGKNLHFNIDGVTGWRMLYDNVSFSDARIKENVQPLGNCVEVLKKLRPVTYQYNPKKTPVGLGDQNLGTRLGFIAQEVEEVLPEAVRDVPVPYDPEGVFKKIVDGEEVVIRKEDFGETIKTIQSEQVIPVLVKAVQELAARVELLEASRG